MKCNICNSKKTKKHLQSRDTHGRHEKEESKDFTLYKCLKCDSIFLANIKINNEYYKKYYPKNYYEQKNKRRTFLKFVLKTLFNFSVYKKRKYILKYSKKNRLKILDIGCGDGKFLERLPNKNFKKYGIEINKEGYELCKKRGIEVFNSPIENINFKNKKFDAITLWHVLEHLEKPDKFVSEIKKILNKNGIIIIQTPNTSGLGFKLGKENWFHLDSPRHLNLLNKKSFKKVAEQNNLKILKIINEYYDYPLDLFWSVRKNFIKFIFYPFYPLFKIFSKENITVILKKNDGN